MLDDLILFFRLLHMSVSKLKTAIADASRLVMLWHNTTSSITNILSNIDEFEKSIHAIERYHDSIFFPTNFHTESTFTAHFKEAYPYLTLRLHSEMDELKYELKQYWKSFQDLHVAIQKTLHDGISKLLEETQGKQASQLTSQPTFTVLLEEVLSAQTLLSQFSLEFARKRLILTPLLTESEMLSSVK